MLMTALAASVLALSSATAPAPACTHGQLRVTRGPGQGSAGHLHWPVVFRNTSGAACTLRGFPGVSSLNRRHGHRIGPPAARDHAQPVRRIRLAAHGGTASAVFTQTDVGVFDRSACPPRLSRGLRVFAPNQFRSSFVRLRHRTCSTGPGSTTITAVVKGSSGL